MSQVETAIGEHASVSQSVVEAVAEAKGAAPENLTPPLYDVIDPDALDQLFTATTTAGRMDGRVVFDYDGYEIVVSGDGYVAVHEQDT